MDIFSLEHGKLAYWTDFALYGAAVGALSALMGFFAPPGYRLEDAALCALGLVCWSFVEYAMHRFVLHGMRPFSDWHAQHHQRPQALISAPTALSATLIVGLVFLPALLLAGLRPAVAFTLGIVVGYLAYGLVHHATHHWRSELGWLRQRKQWHAMHHHAQSSRFGVTVSWWDRVFRTPGG